jgi:FAD/FMN-containing dehydrogenase
MGMNKEAIKNKLVDIAGPRHVFTEKSHRLCYRFGNVVDYRLGPPSFLPDFVVKVGSAEQISSVLKLANEHGIPVVVWGGGTDFSGANSPIKNGIVLDLKGLDKIEVNEKERSLTAGAGAILEKIGQEADKKGFLFEHEQTSQPSATLGGAIATNAFGYRSGRYRSIGNLILGMEAVLPTGEIIRIKPLFKTSTGYDLISLLVGSEGTLGVVTEVTLRLAPKPETRDFFTYVFSSIDEALESVERIYGIVTPDFFELFELSFVEYLESRREFLEMAFGSPVPEELLGDEGYPAVLTIGFEGMRDVVSLKKNLLEAAVSRAAVEMEEGDYYKDRFIRYHREFKAILEILPVTLESHSYASFDLALPMGGLAEMVRAIHQIARKYPNSYLLDIDLYSAPSVVGVDFFVPLEKDDYWKLSKELYGRVLEFGGSVSSTHGIGTRLQPYLGKDLGPEVMEVANRIKRALDPNGILNPGKLGDMK